MNIYICSVCGHIEFNDVPDTCPVCFVPKDKFSQNNDIFIESKEKSPEADARHVPSIIIEKKCGLIPDVGCTDVHVRIGETLHPMEEKHYIQYIDCYHNNNYIGRAMLSPNGLYPAAAFHLKESSGKITITQNCNLHGAWINETDL